LSEADRLKFKTIFPIVVIVVVAVVFLALVLFVEAITYGGKLLVKLYSGPILTPKP
jgi:hypothetical protein